MARGIGDRLDSAEREFHGMLERIEARVMKLLDSVELRAARAIEERMNRG